METPTVLGADLSAALAAASTKALGPAAQHRVPSAQLTAAAAKTARGLEKVRQGLARPVHGTSSENPGKKHLCNTPVYKQSHRRTHDST